MRLLIILFLGFGSFLTVWGQSNQQMNEPEMVFVKGGTFIMGDVLNDYEHSDEKPTYSVTLSDFYIGKYEISQAEWVAIMGKNPSYVKGDSLPVENISWNDVRYFLVQLNAKTGKNYRLPTEEEWEYAAREGGKNVRFGNGKETINPSEINFTAIESWKVAYSIVGEYPNKIVAVNSFVPNALGIYNMSGNVWEWCSDLYEKYSRKSSQNDTDETPDYIHVFRGGAWNSDPQNCRTSARNSNRLTFTNDNLGFRVAYSSK